VSYDIALQNLHDKLTKFDKDNKLIIDKFKNLINEADEFEKLDILQLLFKSFINNKSISNDNKTILQNSKKRYIKEFKLYENIIQELYFKVAKMLKRVDISFIIDDDDEIDIPIYDYVKSYHPDIKIIFDTQLTISSRSSNQIESNQILSVEDTELINAYTLICAILTRNKDIIDCILNIENIDLIKIVNKKTLYAVIETGNIKVFKYIIHNENINILRLINKKTLIYSIQNGNMEIFDYIINIKNIDLSKLINTYTINTIINTHNTQLFDKIKNVNIINLIDSSTIIEIINTNNIELFNSFDINFNELMNMDILITIIYNKNKNLIFDMLQKININHLTILPIFYHIILSTNIYLIHHVISNSTFDFYSFLNNDNNNDCIYIINNILINKYKIDFIIGFINNIESIKYKWIRQYIHILKNDKFYYNIYVKFMIHLKYVKYLFKQINDTLITNGICMDMVKEITNYIY
jgi:hypothetical protein